MEGFSEDQDDLIKFSTCCIFSAKILKQTNSFQVLITFFEPTLPT